MKWAANRTQRPEDNSRNKKYVGPADGKVKLYFCDFKKIKIILWKRTLYQFGKEICIILNKWNNEDATWT